MIRSSVSAFLTWRTCAALIGVPLAFLVAVEASSRIVRPHRYARAYAAILLPIVALWTFFGSRTYNAEWLARSEKRISQNAVWVFGVSWLRATVGDGCVLIPDQFLATDGADFEPVGLRPA